MTSLRDRAATGPAAPSFAHLPTGFVCHGCGERWPAAAPAPLRCPMARDGDGIDHLLVRTLDTRRLRFPRGGDPNPFIRYRTLFHAYHVARALGWADRDYVAYVERLDRAVASVDGRGFRVTPLIDAAALADRLGFGTRGSVLVKDETGNVSGSHKARHLFGTLLELEIAAELARAVEPAGAASRRPVPEHARFAIASCGNAGLAAAVVAHAADRDLEVFIPPDADPAVVARLEALGARVVACEREPGVAGDPTVARLRRAVDGGAVAFTCQGNENGFAIEGGQTLGWELATDLAAAGRRLDRLFVQVGGGALASSCIAALEEALALGALGDFGALPRIHAVQTRGAWPLARAYELVARRLLARLDRAAPPARRRTVEPLAPVAAADRAERLRAFVATPQGAGELERTTRHRADVMWPWESEPHSLAHGILDDETYDWYAVVRGMLVTGGYPVVVDEALVGEAVALGRETTGIDVDPTGTAGLAGLLELRRRGAVGDDETVAVLFTGVTRRAGSPNDGPGTPSAHGGRT